MRPARGGRIVAIEIHNQFILAFYEIKAEPTHLPRYDSLAVASYGPNALTSSVAWVSSGIVLIHADLQTVCNDRFLTSQDAVSQPHPQLCVCVYVACMGNTTKKR